MTQHKFDAFEVQIDEVLWEIAPHVNGETMLTLQRETREFVKNYDMGWILISGRQVYDATMEFAPRNGVVEAFSNAISVGRIQATNEAPSKINDWVCIYFNGDASWWAVEPNPNRLCEELPEVAAHWAHAKVWRRKNGYPF